MSYSVSVHTEPPLDAIQEVDEDVLAEQYEEYRRSQHTQPLSQSKSHANAGKQKQTFESDGGGMDVDAPLDHPFASADAYEDDYGMDESALYELIAQEEEGRPWHG